MKIQCVFFNGAWHFVREHLKKEKVLLWCGPVQFAADVVDRDSMWEFEALCCQCAEMETQARNEKPLSKLIAEYIDLIRKPGADPREEQEFLDLHQGNPGHPLLREISQLLSE